MPLSLIPVLHQPDSSVAGEDKDRYNDPNQHHPAHSFPWVIEVVEEGKIFGFWSRNKLVHYGLTNIHERKEGRRRSNSRRSFKKLSTPPKLLGGQEPPSSLGITGRNPLSFLGFTLGQVNADDMRD